MFFKIGVLKNFAIFTGKHLCWISFLLSCTPVGLTNLRHYFSKNTSRDCFWNFQKNSFVHSPSSILPSFSQNASRLLLQKRLWKYASTVSFRKYKREVVSLVINLFSYDSSTSTFFMLNMAFDIFWSTVFVK